MYVPDANYGSSDGDIKYEKKARRVVEKILEDRRSEKGITKTYIKKSHSGWVGCHYYTRKPKDQKNVRSIKMKMKKKLVDRDTDM